MNVLVFGAGGHIGTAVSSKLVEQGNVVKALKKADYNVITLLNHVDCADKSIDAVVYCVGHCPPGGFLDVIKRPLSQFPPNDFNQEIDWHMRGPLNVFQEFLPKVRDGGTFVFMSSAATRLLQLPRSKRPPIHIYQHLAVIAGEDALVEGMRMDTEVVSRCINVNRIIPPAIIDSPFHAVEGGIKPPTTVTTAEVVAAIVQNIATQGHEDVLMI